MSLPKWDYDHVFTENRSLKYRKQMRIVKILNYISIKLLKSAAKINSHVFKKCNVAGTWYQIKEKELLKISVTLITKERCSKKGDLAKVTGAAVSWMNCLQVSTALSTTEIKTTLVR